MELDLTADQKTFQSTTRKMLEKELPLNHVRELIDADKLFSRELWAQGAELGWAALLVPEELGGGSISGDGLRDLAIVAEEFGRGAIPGPLVGVNVVISALAEDESHAETVEGLMAGELVATWAAYEPGAGWAPLEGSTIAKPSASGGYVVDGVKDRVEFGANADLFLVIAQTEQGPIQLLVPADAAGVTVTAGKGPDITRPMAQIRFDQVEVGAEAVVKPAVDSATSIARQAQIASVLLLAETCGSVARAFELSVEWGFDRYSFGRPLASYQALKHRWADSKAHLESCFATTEAAVAAVSTSAADAAELVSIASAYVGDTSVTILQDIVQIFGGLAITWEHDAHFYVRKATSNKFLYGTPTEHRRALARQLTA